MIDFTKYLLPSSQNFDCEFRAIYGLLEEYGSISHILAAIFNRPTFSLSELLHYAMSVRNASRAYSFRTST